MSKNKAIEPLDLNFEDAVKAVVRGASPPTRRQPSRTFPTDKRSTMKMDEQERVQESDLVLPALRLMSEREDGYISTTDLIGELVAVFNPSGKDAEIIDGRSDTYFSQKVRNLICHKDSPNNMIARGYAEHHSENNGLLITDEGRAFLASLSD